MCTVTLTFLLQRAVIVNIRVIQTARHRHGYHHFAIFHNTVALRYTETSLILVLKILIKVSNVSHKTTGNYCSNITVQYRIILRAYLRLCILFAVHTHEYIRQICALTQSVTY